MRNINISDLDKDYIELLEQLAIVGKITHEQFTRFVEKNGKNIFVIEENNKIIATITLIIEEKLIHNCGKVLHVEDIVVDKLHRKNGTGKKLLEFAIQYAKDNNCYKIILDCSEDVKKFYESVGFSCKNLQMSYYI